MAVRRGELLLDARFLAELDERSFRAAFVDDLGSAPLQPGIGDRVLNLRQLGSRLRDTYGGSFERVVDLSGGSLEKFAEISAGFRAFDDPIRKLTMLNAIMLSGSDLVEFDRSPDPAIDYHLVKQAVRQGLVIPDAATAQKLRAGRFLSSDESLRLRTAVLIALVEVADDTGVSSAVVDNAYWSNRRTCAEEVPDCLSCIFEGACAKRVEFGIPLEKTRYY